MAPRSFFGLPLRHLAMWDSTFEDVTMGMNPSLFRRALGTTPLRYALAAATVVTALLVSSFLSAWVGDRVAYLLLLPAIALSAWYCGTGPSILAVVLSLASAL